LGLKKNSEGKIAKWGGGVGGGEERDVWVKSLTNPKEFWYFNNVVYLH
jgi:hypothetical protein